MFKYALKGQNILQFACMTAGLLVSATAVAMEKLPEVDKDGLHLIKDAPVRIAYAKPGAKLDQYSKVMLLDCFVRFKKNWERGH